MQKCCPACGLIFANQECRWPYSNGQGSFDICPCCNFEYAVSDDNYGHTFETWRWLWILNGARYLSSASPEDYDAAAQLTNIGLDLEYYRERQKYADDPVTQTIMAALMRIRAESLKRHVRKVLRAWNPRRISGRFPDEYEDLIPEAVRLIDGYADRSTIEQYLQDAEGRMGVACSGDGLFQAAASLYVLERADLEYLLEFRIPRAR